MPQVPGSLADRQGRRAHDHGLPGGSGPRSLAAFPLADPLPSTAFAAPPWALFGSFAGITGSSDFPRSWCPSLPACFTQPTFRTFRASPAMLLGVWLGEPILARRSQASNQPTQWRTTGSAMRARRGSVPERVAAVERMVTDPPRPPVNRNAEQCSTVVARCPLSEWVVRVKFSWV
jgi:hypothetical protein